METALLAAAAGIAIGLVLGTLGGGGAILAIPFLVYVFDQPPQSAMAGALIIVTLSSITAVLTHSVAGRVLWRQGVAFGLLGVVGAWAGSQVSVLVDGDLLLFWFGVLLLVVAGLMIRRTLASGQPQSPTTPGPQDRVGVGPIHPARLIATATGVGLLTGFFGVGGGFAVVPALVLALETPMTLAVGTSLVVIVLNSLTALTTRLTGGITVDWTIIAPFAVAASLAGVAGARVAHRLPAHVLTRSFAGLLIAAGVWTGAQGLAAYL